MGIAFEDNIQDVLSAFGLPRASEWRLLPKSAAKRDELVKVSFADHGRCSSVSTIRDTTARSHRLPDPVPVAPSRRGCTCAGALPP